MPDATAPLDVAHIAKLANLPLTDEEREALAADCAAVLEAFSLRDVEPVTEDERTAPTFEDLPDPWPEAGVEAIVEGFPKRDGRHLEP